MGRRKLASTISRQRLSEALDRLLPAAHRPEWRQRGACRGADPDLFFPAAPPDEARIAAAKRICNGDAANGVAACPVQLDCLADAMFRHERHGIWGGMTYNERNRLRKTRYERNRLERGGGRRVAAQSLDSVS